MFPTFLNFIHINAAVKRSMILAVRRGWILDDELGTFLIRKFIYYNIQFLSSLATRDDVKNGKCYKITEQENCQFAILFLFDIHD